MISIKDVNHHYRTGELSTQILFGVTAEIERGEIVILTGPSGSGKSTLLSLIGALRSTQAGSLTVLGHELNGAPHSLMVRVRTEIGYIFQAHNLLDSLTALQNVQMSVLLHPGISKRTARHRAEEVLDAVRLGDYMERYPHELSGGQKQRVAVARALAGEPKIILADEPTASLDRQAGRDVAELIHDLAKRQGCAAVVVSHDNRILDIADRIVQLEDGRLDPATSAGVGRQPAHCESTRCEARGSVGI